MIGLPALVTDLCLETLRTPRAGVRRLLEMDLPMEARWLGLLLVTVLSVFVTGLSLLVLPPGSEPGLLLLLADPFVGVPSQALSLVVAVAAIAGIGRVFGGRGGFADALIVIVWIEFLMTLTQMAELAVMMVVPPAGALLAFAVVAWFLWVIVNAIAELHGFRNLILVFLGLAGGFVVVVVALALLLSGLGILTVT